MEIYKGLGKAGNAKVGLKERKYDRVNLHKNTVRMTEPGTVINIRHQCRLALPPLAGRTNTNQTQPCR